MGTVDAPLPALRGGATVARRRDREARVTRDGILELEQRRFKAMCDGDADALGALLHTDLTYAFERHGRQQGELHARRS